MGNDWLSKDQLYGALIFLASVAGILIYVWSLFTFALIVLQLTALVAVGAILVIAAWIGYTMATTPPPAPLDLEASTMSASQTSEEHK